MTPNTNGINNNVAKRAALKDNKTFPFRQNLNAAFGKLSNGHQHAYGPNNNNNWVQQPPTSNIWSTTSYSDVVAKPPIDTNKMNQSFGVMNGHRHVPDHDLIRISSFNRNNDRYVDQEEGSQYGPIGTKKSPSSTPSWEPLAAGMIGMNHINHIAKPSPYNSNSSYFTPPAQQQYGMPQSGMQQSKLMNLMSYNDKTAQQHQQQQQNQMMEEQYRYQMMKIQERQQAEWLNGTAAATSSNNLWSPAYRRESPTSPPPNWSSPSPPLAAPPGFEQQYHQPNIAQVNHQNGATGHVTAYDPFKSLSALWEPNRNNNANNNNNHNNNRNTWDQ